MSDPLASGDYARKQIYCPSLVVSWSHGSRFKRAADLAREAGGSRLLDYGCGDGTFLALTAGTFATTVGADVDEKQLADCRERLGSTNGLTFVHTTALESPEHDGAYDTVMCMEVLEHCPEAERLRVLDALRRLTAPGGRVIISVPIEIGPALLGKQMFRAIAAWRGHGDYKYRETYTPHELLRAALARPNLARARYRVVTNGRTFDYCGHKGFDWRVLEQEIRERFIVERRLFTPLPVLRALANSQVWFVCNASHSLNQGIPNP